MTSEIHQKPIPASGNLCAFCGILLTDNNSSREHIIPNAIGGRKTVQGFICRDCNNETGRTWDSDLAESLKLLCTTLRIKRQRGKNQSIDVFSGDKELVMSDDGTVTYRKPIVHLSDIDGKTSIRVMARNRRELKVIARRICNKYPDISFKELIEESVSSSEELTEPIMGESIDGVRRPGMCSIIKSCLAMVYQAGYSPACCETARAFLFEDGEPCFKTVFQHDLVKNRPKNILSHCINVCGHPKRRLILAYVEYFSSLRWIICLSSSYVGEAFNCSYSIDLNSGSEFNLEVNLADESSDLTDVYRSRNPGVIIMEFPMQAPIEHRSTTGMDKGSDPGSR